MGKYMGLINQVYSLPSLIREQYDDLEPKIRGLLSTPEIFKFMKIVLTGCGDSFAAALSVKDAFSVLTGINTEVVPAIELSRSVDKEYFGWAPMNPLVIAISNSGSVARVGEAIERARHYGAFTLGVTGNKKSILANASTRILELNIPPFEAAPGTRSYVVSLLALLLIAVRIGEVKGRYTMDKAMQIRFDLIKQADLLEGLLPEMDNRMKEFSEIWKIHNGYDFIGTGMEFGSAWYCHAKIMEMIGRYSSYKNSEDWLHTNLFIRDNHQTAAIVFADKRNPAFSRTKECIVYANSLERPLMIISNEDFPCSCIKTPQSDFFFNSCITNFTPINIMANYIANEIGEEDGRGCKGVWSIANGAKCIRDSKIEIL